MPTVRKSVIVPHRCERMFALVEDVESYPQFMPWCAAAEVDERTAAVTRAHLDIAFKGLKTRIATINRKQPPHRMTLELEEGPFDRFDGEWRFTPLGEQGCRVEFRLDYELASGVLDVALRPLFGHIADTMVERFVERAGR